MDVDPADMEILFISNAMIRETALPDGEFRAEAARETTFDQAHGALNCNALGRKEQMDVIGHDDEGVELEVAFVAVMLECFYKEFRVLRELEEAATVVCSACCEERSGTGGTGGDRHGGIVRLLGFMQAEFWKEYPSG